MGGGHYERVEMGSPEASFPFFIMSLNVLQRKRSGFFGLREDSASSRKHILPTHVKREKKRCRLTTCVLPSLPINSPRSGEERGHRVRKTSEGRTTWSLRYLYSRFQTHQARGRETRGWKDTWPKDSMPEVVSFSLPLVTATGQERKR